MLRDSHSLAALGFLAAFAGGCNAHPASSGSSASAPGLHELYSGNSSGLLEAQRSVVTSAADWTSLWATVTAHLSPPPPRPSVDLSQESIIVAALGERSTGGFMIHIDSIRAAADGRDVFVTTSRPGRACATTQALTQPVHVVSGPVSTGPTRFVETETTTVCRS